VRQKNNTLYSKPFIETLTANQRLLSKGGCYKCSVEKLPASAEKYGHTIITIME